MTGLRCSLTEEHLHALSGTCLGLSPCGPWRHCSPSLPRKKISMASLPGPWRKFLAYHPMPGIHPAAHGLHLLSWMWLPTLGHLCLKPGTSCLKLLDIVLRVQKHSSSNSLHIYTLNLSVNKTIQLDPVRSLGFASSCRSLRLSALGLLSISIPLEPKAFIF